MFCEKPFEQFEIDENGNVNVCCYVLSQTSNQPLSIGNLVQNTPDDIWNSKCIQEVRKSILDNSFKFCSKELCGLLKYKHLPAAEEITNPFHKEILSKQSIVLDKGPQILAFRYDATCNLRCPSCRTTPISFKGKDFEKAQLVQKQILNWDFKDSERIVFSTYGDPFASKLYREVLQSLDTRKYPQLRITILTNGILLTSDMWTRLNKIHQSIDRISVSIDAATEETYKIVRIGGDASRLLENLLFIGNLRQNNDISFFEINFVVQKANYREMKAFIGLGKQFNCDRVHFTPIQNIGAHTKEEYSEIAVHNRFHPEHKAVGQK
jgi:pyruvate-formate lyase-activating enzyme